MIAARSFGVPGAVIWNSTLAPPADSPKIVMLAGLPPKPAMFRRTQFIAYSWSCSP